MSYIVEIVLFLNMITVVSYRQSWALHSFYFVKIQARRINT